MTVSIPTIDLTCFGPDGSSADRDAAATQLYDACHNLGFVNLKGLGLSRKNIEDAFAFSKKLFDLSVEDKMKAPHPPEAMPHRGYSFTGMEKIYSKAERDADVAANGTGKALRQIEDHKESYEIGSESNKFQPNIFLPEPVFPGFKEQALKLYEDLHRAALRILDALCMALKLSPEDAAHLRSLHSGQNNQLRLLHYPPVETEKLANKVVSRMPPHQDWSSFTFLFQDSVGGLELQDPKTNEYIQSETERDVCILNIGDMMMRYSNGVFPSAMHRVTLPRDASAGGTDGFTKGRYSIPYFVAPDHEGLIEPMPSLLQTGKEPVYEPLRWCDYGEYMSKHMYKGKDEVNGK